MRTPVGLFVVTVLIASASAAGANNVLVDWTGAGDYTTIQEGIDAVASGDTVWVAPGTYLGENNRALFFGGRELKLLSTGGRSMTTIDAERLDNVFWLSTLMTSETVISGFTVQNGVAPRGGGFYLHEHASPIIMDCEIIGCEATQYSTGGGGMACYGGSPTLIDCVFSGCQGDYGGALLTYYGSSPALTRVRFEGNQGYGRAGGWYHEGTTSDPIAITDCVFYGNQCPNATGGGGGLYLRDASPTITGCTFARNYAVHGAGIHLIWGAAESSPTIENCIFAFSTRGTAINADEGCEPVSERCIVFGNEDGNELAGTCSDTLVRDPRFCGLLTGDLTLCGNSPALPDNNPWTVLMGAHGEGCADCDSPVDRTTWGRIKELYRLQ
jgi:hypothetical protein